MADLLDHSIWPSWTKISIHRALAFHAWKHSDLSLNLWFPSGVQEFKVPKLSQKAPGFVLEPCLPACPGFLGLFTAD